MDQQERLLKAKEAARILSFGLAKTYAMGAAGELPVLKPRQRKEQKTLSRSREKQTDLRFQEFLSELKDYWTAANSGIPFDFSSKDGSQLKALLKDRPSLTARSSALASSIAQTLTT